MPATWLYLSGLGFIGRTRRAVPAASIAAAAPRAPKTAQEIEDEDAGESRWQLLAGAATHMAYSVWSGIRRPKADPRPAQRREPGSGPAWREEPSMAAAAPAMAASAAATGRAQREIRVVDTRPPQPQFDAVDMDGFDDYGYQPAAQQPRARPVERPEPPQAVAFDEAYDVDVFAEPATAEDAAARRSVDTSRATVRHGRNDWNGSYAASRLGKKRWERDEEPFDPETGELGFAGADEQDDREDGGFDGFEDIAPMRRRSRN